MGRRRRAMTEFEESALLNNESYRNYYMRLTELAISMFEWKGLPGTVDSRYMEVSLYENGGAIYFNDEIVGNLCLDYAVQGQLGVYGYPVKRRVYSRYTNYTRICSPEDSVIIWNNYLHTNSIFDVKMFSKRLALLDRIIDVNVNAQKTPILIIGTEGQRLTLKNLYKEYDGNAPVIFGSKNLDVNALKSLTTNAPYVADKLYNLKVQIWNEALTYLGIPNVSVEKRERLISDEVDRNQGGTIASRKSRLKCRQMAVESINRMFGTSISVGYNDEAVVTGVDGVRLDKNKM